MKSPRVRVRREQEEKGGKRREKEGKEVSLSLRKWWVLERRRAMGLYDSSS